jgi:hypothetical protein
MEDYGRPRKTMKDYGKLWNVMDDYKRIYDQNCAKFSKDGM